jgi:hypothetical protein
MTDEDPSTKCSAFDRHLEDFKQWAETTTIMHEMVSEMRNDTRYLNYLPMIVDELKELRGSLVTAATGQNRLPLSATLALVSSMAFCIAILGGLLYSVHNPGKNMHITPSSITFHDGADSQTNRNEPNGNIRDPHS